jgi:hypothetical protein
MKSRDSKGVSGRGHEPVGLPHQLLEDMLNKQLHTHPNPILTHTWTQDQAQRIEPTHTSSPPPLLLDIESYADQVKRRY